MFSRVLRADLYLRYLKLEGKVRLNVEVERKAYNRHDDGRLMTLMSMMLDPGADSGADDADRFMMVTCCNVISSCN